jgi:hypothetical protein
MPTESVPRIHFIAIGKEVFGGALTSAGQIIEIWSRHRERAGPPIRHAIHGGQALLRVIQKGILTAEIDDMGIPFEDISGFQHNWLTAVSSRRKVDIDDAESRGIGEGQLIAANGSGIDRRAHNYDGQYRIEGNTNSGYPRPEKYLAIMLGLVGLGGFIFLCKGIYGESEIMVLSGWVIAAIAAALGAMWIMSGHVPFISENAAVSFGASGASATTYRS